ncbi:MAG: SPFH domain-containing protein [Phycisphaerae bacterium]
MREAPLPGDRRAQWASLAGLLLQALLFGVVLAVGLWSETRSDAMVAGARHLLGGVLIWLILLIVFTQRRRSRLEDLETEQLTRAQSAGLSSNLFAADDESLLLERRRLAWTHRFLLPFFTILLAIYHIGGTFVWWGWSLGQPVAADTWHRAPEPLVAMIFVAAAAFACFVYARYVVGMARRAEWRLIRAGGSYLIGNALTATVLVVAMALAGNPATSVWAEPVACYVIRFAILLLGIELLTNFVMEFYRPRHADEEIRPAFDSRLLALFSEPGGIVRSIADTINYQFGFEVSGTWFYKLLQRSVFPLAMLTVLALILLSSIVVIDVDEQAYVERFGAVRQTNAAPLNPGFGLKLPWPIDHVVRERVHKVRTLVVGSRQAKETGKADRDHEEDELKQAVLWTEEHTHLVSGMLVMVANPEVDALAIPGLSSEENLLSGSAGSAGGSEGVGLLMISVELQYHIDSLFDYAYRYREPERVLETIAFQELFDYAAGHDATFLMGPGREAFGREMMARLQQRCNEMKTGIALTSISLHAHPPAQEQVAATFQEVVSAEIRKSAAIERAKGEHNRMLTLAAGSVKHANELNDAVLEMNRLTGEAERLGTAEASEAAAKAVARVDDLLMGNAAKGIAPASGAASAAIASARAARSSMISRAESKQSRYQNDLAAFRVTPELFKMRRYLQLLRSTLPHLRKFVYTGDRKNLIVEYVTEQRSTLDLTTDKPEGQVR